MGEEFKLKFPVRSAEVTISLVQAGLGVSILPECHLGRDIDARISVLEFAEPWARRMISIATARGRILSSAARVLLRQLPEGTSNAGGDAEKRA